MSRARDTFLAAQDAAVASGRWEWTYVTCLLRVDPHGPLEGLTVVITPTAGSPMISIVRDAPANRDPEGPPYYAEITRPVSFDYAVTVLREPERVAAIWPF